MKIFFIIKSLKNSGGMERVTTVVANALAQHIIYGQNLAKKRLYKNFMQQKNQILLFFWVRIALCLIYLHLRVLLRLHGSILMPQ